MRDEACNAAGIAGRLGNHVTGIAPAPLLPLTPLTPLTPQAGSGGLQRIADVPIYFTDPIVRRASSLQQTRDARSPRASMNGVTIARLGLAAGDQVRVMQAGGEALLELARDDGLPADCVRVAAAHFSTAGLGPMSGDVTVERA